MGDGSGTRRSSELSQPPRRIWGLWNLTRQSRSPGILLAALRLAFAPVGSRRRKGDDSQEPTLNRMKVQHMRSNHDQKANHSRQLGIGASRRAAVVGLLALATCGCSGTDATTGGSGGSTIAGGTGVGGESHSGGATTNGGTQSSVGGLQATGGGSLVGGGTGGATSLVSCRGQPCPVGQLCEDLIWIPNFGNRTDTYTCKDNPCGTAPLSCSCAASVCNGFQCAVSAGNLTCTYQAVCAAPDTPIATPSGDRPIESIRVGDLVYSVQHNTIRAVKVIRTGRHLAVNHHVVRATLGSGRVLEISAPHPTADGRTFGELKAGDLLDGQPLTSAEVVAYAHEYTYDILPDSDTGYYFAAGAMIGSTLLPMATDGERGLPIAHTGR